MNEGARPTSERLVDPSTRFFNLCQQIQDAQFNITFSEEDFTALVAEVQQLLSEHAPDLGEYKELAESVIGKSQSTRDKLFAAQKAGAERREREAAEEQARRKASEPVVEPSEPTQAANPNFSDEVGSETTAPVQPAQAQPAQATEPVQTPQQAASGPSVVVHADGEKRGHGKLSAEEAAKQREETTKFIAAFAPTGDYYQMLGVASTASRDEIRAEYRKLLKLVHEDTLRGLGIGDAETKDAATEITKQLTTAYGVLSDEQKRAAYDAEQGITQYESQESTKLEVQLQNAYDAEEIVAILQELVKRQHVFTYSEKSRYSWSDARQEQITAQQLIEKLQEVQDVFDKETTPQALRMVFGTDLPERVKILLERLPPVYGLDRKFAKFFKQMYADELRRQPKRGIFG